MKFNINESVKVKLTPLGISILKKQRDEINKAIFLRGGEPVGDYIPALDEEGYTKFQMWDLMSKFGEHMSIASKLVFETEIIICVDEKEKIN